VCHSRRHDCPIDHRAARTSRRRDHRAHRRAVVYLFVEERLMLPLSEEEGIKTTMLEARNITVKYGPRAAVTGVSLLPKSGEVIAIIGPNGAGKSTFLRAQNDALPDAGGQVLLDGNPLSPLARRAVRRRLRGGLGCDRRRESGVGVGRSSAAEERGSRDRDWPAP